MAFKPLRYSVDLGKEAVDAVLRMESFTMGLIVIVLGLCLLESRPLLIIRIDVAWHFGIDSERYETVAGRQNGKPDSPRD